MSAESPEATGTSRSNAERRILRRPEVEARIGFKRSQIYKLMNEGLFPKAKHIGMRTVGWDSVEVDQWIAEHLDGPV